jgi:NADH-quinone oxidoreductase subunit A
MLSDFGFILLYILTGLTVLLVFLGIARLLRPHRPNVEKLSTYESGEEPEGNANIRFNVRFYVVALIFVLFEVELVFLFPWATVFGQADLINATDGLWGWFTFGEMLIFIGILAFGLMYAWVKGYLEWVRPQPEVPTTNKKIPLDIYKKVNEKYR